MDKNTQHIDLKKAYEEQLLMLEEKELMLEKKVTIIEEKELMLEEKATIIEAKDLKIAALEHELKQLTNLIFLRKQEKFIPSKKEETAPTLFDVPAIEEIKPAQVKTITYDKTLTKKQANKGGRAAFPEQLRREEVVINPTEIDLKFAKKIGEDVTEILSYTPAELFVKRIIRTKYQEVSTGNIYQHQAPARGFERSKVDVSIPAQLLVSKYVDHLPIDRQIKMFARLGLTISDSSINNWMNAAGYFLTPLYEKHKELVLNSHYLHADETTIRVMDSNKKGTTHQGYYWVYQSHADKLVLFEYQRGRGKEGPREMLKYFKGYLQTDGYQVYEEFGKKDGIVLIHCMAHARRKFMEALDNDKVRAEYVLEQMQRLYAIERYIKDHALNGNNKLNYRKEHAKPILASLGEWMLNAYQEVLPASVIGKALQYSLQRWARLSVYAETDLLHIDNNPIENSIRPVALGRKNYLFAGSHHAAQRAAMFYSLLATCKNYGVNPYEWLKDVLNRINEHPNNKITELLPQNWKSQEQ
jgi:transposase